MSENQPWDWEECDLLEAEHWIDGKPVKRKVSLYSDTVPTNVWDIIAYVVTISVGVALFMLLIGGGG